MDRVRNPYSPGAGTPPPALVGRQAQLDDMDVALQRRLIGRPAKSVILTGLRGVGKTVLLNEFAKTAKMRNYLHAHVEADEALEFPAAMAAALRAMLFQLDAAYRLGEKIKRALGVLKAFAVRIPNGPEFTMDIAPVLGPADSGNLASDLSNLLCEVSDVAKATGVGLFLTIDELQYLAPGDLSAFMLGLHRAAQLSYPLVFAGAGLPSVPGLSGEAKSYAERMVDFATIDSLSRFDAAQAIVLPAKDEGVTWHPEAVALVNDLTKGYPYFLQEFGKQAWDAAQGTDTIYADDVEASVPCTLDRLDQGFFRVRMDRTTDAERMYLRAMAELGSGPYASADVAANLEKKTRQLGPIRDSVIKRGLCYSPRWGQIAFTVPMFDDFMRRWMPSP